MRAAHGAEAEHARCAVAASLEVAGIAGIDGDEARPDRGELRFVDLRGDDLADEGPGAGPASLVGLKIAREQGWTAPEGEQ